MTPLAAIVRPSRLGLRPVRFAGIMPSVADLCNVKKANAGSLRKIRKLDDAAVQPNVGALET